MRYAILLVAACGGNGDGGDGIFGSDAAMPTKRGFLFVQSYDAMNVPNMPTRGGNASAGFWMVGSSYCTNSAPVGPCEVMMCPAGTAPPPDASAGTITITGGVMPITLTPNADKSYTAITSQTAALFTGGASVMFSAAGADVPAFSTSLTMPAKATITSPVEPPSSSPYLIVNRAQDFTVRWSGGGGTFQIGLYSPTTTWPALMCKFPASAGSGTIPSSALMMLAAGMGSFSMSTIADADKTAGDYAVDVSAYFNAVWADNSIVSGPTTFQ